MIAATRWLLIGMVLVLAAVGPLGAELAPELAVGTFHCDVTPPIGHLLYAHPLKTVEHPLLAKGVVLEQGGKRYVLCAMDWCVLSGGAHTLLRRKMADAAGTDLARTAIQCVHVHTGPIIDTDTKRLLAEIDDPPKYYDPAFLDKVAGSLAGAVGEAVANLKPCDRIGISQAKVDRVASNRRIMVDGKVRWRGSSGGRNPALAKLPEGTIDAFVAVAGYGDGCTSYICTAQAFKEGSYEPRASAVGPGSEKVLKAAIRRLLGME